MRLVDLQHRFWQLITAPEPVARALPGLLARDPGAAPLTGWIAAEDEAAAATRLDVYANMYFFRLLDVLRQDYPALARLVGDDAFHDLVTGYLVAHPSESPSLRWVGRHLPDHLIGHALSVRFPCAPALARLEWVRGEVFDVADAPIATIADVTAPSPEAWSAMRFVMHPSLRVIDLDHEVLPLWLTLERGGQPLPAAPANPTRVVVWRRGHRVFHRTAGAGEAACLRAAARGLSFAALCEALLPHAGEDTPRQAVGFLRTWLEHELVSSITFPP